MTMEQDEAEKLPEVILYTDGGCEPNPGAGGYGALVVCGSQTREISGGFKRTTNNRMELFAAIAGLESLAKPCCVKLVSDSRYVVDAMTLNWAKRWRANGWWRTKRERAANADLWERLLCLCERHRVVFQWVKGHAGHEDNERCDALAMQALKQADLPADPGYEESLVEPSPVGQARESTLGYAQPRGATMPGQKVAIQSEFAL